MQFKIGDTFQCLYTITGAAPGELSDFTPFCQIRSLTGSIFANAECSWADPGANLQVLISVPSTANWWAGPGIVDLRYRRGSDNFVRSSESIPIDFI